MGIAILLEPTPTGFRASTGGPLDLVAEAATDTDEMSKIRTLVDDKLQSAKMIELPFRSVASSDNPWQQFRGLFQDDPEFTEWQNAVAENRTRIDNAPDAL